MERLLWPAQFAYNHILIFDGRYVAQDLSISEGENHTILSAHVDILEHPATMKTADFIPSGESIHFRYSG